MSKMERNARNNKICNKKEEKKGRCKSQVKRGNYGTHFLLLFSLALR